MSSWIYQSQIRNSNSFFLRSLWHIWAVSFFYFLGDWFVFLVKTLNDQNFFFSHKHLIIPKKNDAWCVFSATGGSTFAVVVILSTIRQNLLEQQGDLICIFDMNRFESFSVTFVIIGLNNKKIGFLMQGWTGSQV